MPHDHNLDCLEQYGQVELGAVCPGILLVKGDSFPRTKSGSTGYLPKPGHARFDAGDVVGVSTEFTSKLVWQVRAWTDQAHVSLEYIQELGKFVDAEFSNE
jgi:hypothetical protein